MPVKRRDEGEDGITRQTLRDVLRTGWCARGPGLTVEEVDDALAPLTDQARVVLWLERGDGQS